MPEESIDIKGFQDVLAKMSEISKTLEKHAKDGTVAWVRISEKAQQADMEEGTKAPVSRTGTPAKFVSIRQARAIHGKPSGRRGR